MKPIDIKYISSVKSFYKYVFSVVGSSNSLVWSIPKPVFSNLNSNNVNNDLKKLDVVFPFGIASNNNKIESVNNSNSNSFNNTSNNLFNFQASKDISINNTKFDDNNDNSLNILSADFNISNDSYLNGFNKNNSLSENAGFASNHYIIIGTVCLILASIIVAVSIFIIKNL